MEVRSPIVGYLIAGGEDLRLAIEATALFAFTPLCGAAGFGVPQLFDRDVGGALASTVFGLTGVVAGPIVSLAAILSMRANKRRTRQN